MNKKRILGILMIGILLLSNTAFSEDTDFSYGIILTEYEGDRSDLTIPSEIDGKTVIGVGKNYCNENSTISKVTLPEGVTIIGDHAFALSGLTEIVFRGNECMYIGSGAFSGTGLKHAELPRFVDAMGEGVFDECFELEEIVLPEYLQEIPAYTFRECGMETVRLPMTCIAIGEMAFYGCTALKDVIWSEGLMKIGESAFESCEALERMVLPEKLTIIEQYAFYDCENLSYCEIPESVNFIADSAFEGCDQLVLGVVRGSYAFEFAEKQGIDYLITRNP